MNRQERRRIAVFVAERDAMLRALDPRKMAEFAKKWGVPQPAQWVLNADIACMHKARLAIATFTEEEKAESRRWLLEHGFVAAPSGAAERAVEGGIA